MSLPWIMVSAVAWLVLAAVGFVAVCLGGSRIDRCIAYAARRTTLAARLKRFFARSEENRLVMRLLAVAGFGLALFPWLGAWGSGAAPGMTLLIAVLIMVVGAWLFLELVAPALPEPLAAPALGVCLAFLEGVRLLLGPFALPARIRRQRRIQGVGADAKAEPGCLEEEVLRMVLQRLDVAAGTGTGAASGHRMILGILDLDKTLVREVMTPRVDVTALPDSVSIDDVKAKIVASGHSRLPIYHESLDHIVGVVHAKDLLDVGRCAPDSPVSSLLRRPVLIPESKNVAALLAEFQQNRNHFAVVLDEYGGTAGIVTIEDLVEEIIGEIRDEYDVDEHGPDVRRLGEGVVVADGRAPVFQLVAKLGLRLPAEQDYDTVGGFVITLLGRIPAKGEIIDTPELRCEVLDADPRRVLKVRITKKFNVITDDHG